MSRRRLAGLYVITDTLLTPAQSLLTRVEAALRGGASIVQYRDKGTDIRRRSQQLTDLLVLCRRYEALCIVNDDVELAHRHDADGVHLGRDDTDIAAARARLGGGKVIGASCYNDVDRALNAQAAGADYVAFGRFFTSGTKPLASPANLKTLRLAKRHLRVPIAAIGGITVDNAPPLLEAGADMLAVVGGVFGAPDIEAAAGHLSALIQDLRQPNRG
ncbi:MAG: thiamine phosphate synthase [Chromatiales bacterium]|nr:thiamine phosphate synthase [Chromatiales bacterium]